MKAKLRQNIILFMVGIFLWRLVIVYLQNHPGEKAALLPSLEILFQKVQKQRYRVIGRDPELIVMKANLQKNFDELAYILSQNGGCFDSLLVLDIQQARDDVSQIPYYRISAQYNYYQGLAMSFKQRIEETCQ